MNQPLPQGHPQDVDKDLDQDMVEEPGVKRSAFDSPNLNAFLGQIHEESVHSGKEGMPSIKWLKENFATKSGRIRYLTEKGFTPKEISDHLGIKYQHAYNVASLELVKPTLDRAFRLL